MNKTNRLARIAWVAILLLVVCACARVPKETVTLSDTIGKDITTMRTAHSELVRQYFGGMRDNINEFVDYTYRPYIIEKTMEDLNLIEEIQDAAAGRSELDPLDVMEIYVEEAMNQIAAFRAEMLAPINQQESNLMRTLNQSYDMMVNANATVTAHLRSVTKVHEAQQEALSYLGIEDDLRAKISEGVADVSGQVKTQLEKARAADAKLDELPGKINKILQRLNVKPANQGVDDGTE